MAEIRWIQMMFLLLQITGVATEQHFIFKEGVEVTLPCNNAMGNCEETTWLFSYLTRESTATLAEGGQIHKAAKAKADRLIFTDTCSLVIKKVTEEDAGQYTCRQFRSGKQKGPDSRVDLSVVNMTQRQDNDEVTLLCSVKKYGDCRHSVKWLLQGRDVDKDHREIKTSQSSCSASVTFLTSLFSNTSWSELFTCAVRDGANVQTFSPQSSVEDTNSATTNRPPPQPPTTTTSTTTAQNNLNSGEDAGKVTTVTTTWTTVRMRAAGETTNTASEDNQTEQEGHLRLIIVSVGLAALIITVVTVNIWTRAKGSKAQTEENMEQIDEDEDEADYENVGEPSASV